MFRGSWGTLSSSTSPRATIASPGGLRTLRALRRMLHQARSRNQWDRIARAHRLTLRSATSRHGGPEISRRVSSPAIISLASSLAISRRGSSRRSCRALCSKCTCVLRPPVSTCPPRPPLRSSRPAFSITTLLETRALPRPIRIIRQSTMKMNSRRIWVRV